MLSYLKRAREHKEFLLKETSEFERGKRHLANMMGVKSEEMTQTDIDDAIKYLFPSGLFDYRARPMMKHPDFLYKAQKDAQFDVEGRPHHYLFYTTLPNYYEALSQLRQHLTNLNKFEDEQLADGVLDPPDENRYQMAGRKWLSHSQLCDRFIEKLSDADYDYFIRCLEKLTSHPYSNRARSFLDQFSFEKTGQSLSLALPKIIRDEESGQLYTEGIEKRREHKVWVKTILNGTGKVDIDGYDILYFRHPYLRVNLLMPLRIAGLQDKVDIVAKVVYKPGDRDPMTNGQGAVATAIRSAISRSIAAYVDPELRERLRLSGLLDRDYRSKERKKFGQMKARRKYTWKKR